MVYCTFCSSETDVEIDDAKGISCCVQCGRVLEEVAFSVDVTFQKDAAGESTVVGQFVNESGVARGIGRIHGGRVYAYQAESHERAQLRGRQHISQLVDQLAVKPREESLESAHRVYKLALQKGFTRGRRTSHVAAACLYLICRQENKPFFLIDFSDALQVSVFSLGAVFLQLAKLLRLENQPQFTKPVDPSLYIHRFANKMYDRNEELVKRVSETAMRLVASMKRDWIQTGRRPSGVCGAALYIATHLHGHIRTKRQIVDVVHIGEFTLTKRLNEFTTTPAGSMKKKEFLQYSDALQKQESAAIDMAEGEEAPKGLVGCIHISQGIEHFRNGMCRECYKDFIGQTGGLFDGTNPPAFSKNREKENKLLELMEVAELEDAKESNEGTKGSRTQDEMGNTIDGGANNGAQEKDTSESKKGKFNTATVKAAESYVEGFDAAIAKAELEDARKRRGSMSTSAAVAVASAYALEEAAVAVGENRGMIQIVHGGNGLPLAAVGDFATAGEDQPEYAEGEEDTLSDISDSEIGLYIAEEEEVKCKEEIWNMMNQDWMERQAAKKAAMEASLKAQEEQRKAMEEAAAAGVQYKRGRGRPLGSKSKPKAIANMPPAETPQEAAMRIINDKKLSSKINYNVLADLFSNEPSTSDPLLVGEQEEKISNKNKNHKVKEETKDKVVRSGKKAKRNAEAMPPPPARTAVSRLSGLSPINSPTEGKYQRLGSLESGYRSPLFGISGLNQTKKQVPKGIKGLSVKPKSKKVSS